MTAAERAREYFKAGYNCSQAVMLAFSERLGLPEEKIKAIAAPLGGGLGRLRETCGGVSGAAVCLGLCFPELGKGELYALVRKLAERFAEENGSYNCGELLTGAGVAAERGGTPEARTGNYYKKRPCAELVYSAAEILEGILRENAPAEE